MKGIIKCVIASAIIIGIGIAIVLVTLAVNGWSVKKPEFEMQTYTAEKDNTSLKIEIGAGSVTTEFYDGDKITIDYPSSNVFKTQISENDGIFYFKMKHKKWFWGSWDIPDTVIKLPKDVIFNLDFEVSAGSVNIASGEYGEVEIDVSAGKLTLNQSNCSSVKCDVSAGNLEIDGLICNKFDCEVSAGKLDVKKLNCPDVKADVSAGNLEINIDGAKADYDIKASVSAGNCNVSNQTGTGGKKLDVDCSAGNITVTFAS